MTTLPARLKILGVLLLACLGGVLSALGLCHRTSRQSSPPAPEDAVGPTDTPPPCSPERHGALAQLLVGISHAYLGGPGTAPKRPSP